MPVQETAGMYRFQSQYGKHQQKQGICGWRGKSFKITQKEIYTTEKYLYAKALRSVAIIVSRKGADENALAAAKGWLRESGKLILCLSDEDLKELLRIKEKDEQPTAEFFEAMLDDLLIHLEK